MTTLTRPTKRRRERQPKRLSAPAVMALFLTASAATGAVQSIDTASASAASPSSSSQTMSQSERNLHRPTHPHDRHHYSRNKQQHRPSLKGRQQQRQQEVGSSRLLPQHNMRGLQKKGKGGGSAFNPNLVAYDPNSSEYMHGNPAAGSFSQGKMKSDEAASSSAGGEGASSTSSSSWSPCPQDPNFAGNRASHDCLSYIYCSGGQVRGSYSSCMGLKFDNSRGVCDWAEGVTCDTSGSIGDVASNATSTSDGSGEGGGAVGGGNKEIGSATAIAVATNNGAGSAGATATNDVIGWNGGSDWGGSWIDGVWVPSGQNPQAPAATPGEGGQQQSSSETAWIATHAFWKESDIVKFPPHPILPAHNLESNAIASGSAELPGEYTSAEGWSSTTRGSKKVVGYYAAWQWYDNAERASPINMQFSKVDRVNFAFFQTDEQGNIWGTDSWADPITMFGPHDWSIEVPEGAGYAPQFNDDNGFDDNSGPDWNYVGRRYVDLGGPNVRCHRATPTGKRDCNGHSVREGLIGRAHEQGALVYPSVGGWSLSDVFPALSADAVARRNFAKNCVGLIREYNFDGIDIDWEFPGYEPHSGTPADKANFVLLLQDIRSALDAYTNATYPDGERTFGLTAALPCGPPIINDQDVPKVSEILTELNLMTYDFHGTWDDKVGINSPLFDMLADKFNSPEYSVDGCVKRWIREGADEAKINIGLPFYGRSYGGATELYASFDGADGQAWWADQGQPQYFNILDRLPEMISLRDDVTKTQYAYFEKGGIVSFDDNQAICDKVEYARKNDLHGFLIWELSGDLTEDLLTPLLDAVNFKLEQGDDFDCELFRLETRNENGEVMGQGDGKPNLWYADWETGTCVNDGKQPAWESEENLFRFKEECCGYKFEYKFDSCVGPPTVEPTKKPTKGPTLSPISTDAPTDDPTPIFGAAQVIGKTEVFGSPTPTSLVLRSAQETAEGPKPPETWCMGGCKGANQNCVGNQNHPQGISDDDCKPCMSGQTFWPCDVDGLCFCWDPATPRIPPAPGSGLALLSEERPCDYFTESIFNSLAPEAQFPYTYEGLCKAIDSYNEGHAEKIFMMGTETERKSELASFLGHTLHESDEWKASREYLICADNQVVGAETFCKPCDSGSFNWETFKCDGVGLAGSGLTFNGYCDHTIQPPAACPCDDTLKSEPAPLEGYIPASKVFFGRGAIQLSWNYNYRAASEALTGDATTFCDDPDLVATTPEYAWGAGVFFWMENLKEETTCHIEALKNQDFGGTLNNINGGLECPAYHGGWHGEAIKLRLNRYCMASSALGLDSILIFEGCKGLNNSFAECLEDGTCPNCQQYSDGSVPTMVSQTVLESTPSENVTTPANLGVTPKTPLNPSPQDVEAITGEVELAESKEDISNTDSTPLHEEAIAGEVALVEEDQSNTNSTPQPVEVIAGEVALAESKEDQSNTDSTPQPVEAIVDEFLLAESKEELSNNESVESAASSSSCSEDLKPVDGLPNCCVPEPAYHGDGACDPNSPYNTAECAFDGGDCCRETCDLESIYGCSAESSEYGPFGYFCINPDLDEYIDPKLCTVSDLTRIGDGRCDAKDEIYNTEACNWDGGDCCEETCDERYAHFTCGDPAYPYDCQNPDLESSSTDNPSPAPVQKDSFVQTAYPTSSPIEPDEEPEAEIVTVIASDDAYIIKGSPDSNHGIEDVLKVKGLASGPNAHDAIIKFVIPASGLSESTSMDAVLKIYSRTDAPHGGIFHIAAETNPPWSETTVTWNTAPDWGARIGIIGSVEAEKWYTLDVTKAVSSLNGEEGAVTIRIRSRDTQMAEYSSKEGDHPPEIFVAYGSLPLPNSNPNIVTPGLAETTKPTKYPTPHPTEHSTSHPTRHPVETTTTSTLAFVPGLYVLNPSDDATIVGDHADQNYGSEKSLQVDNDSGVYDSLIRFELPDIDIGAIASATLRLYCTDGSDSGGIFGRTKFSDWSEATVTWNNAPAGLGSPMHTLGSVNTGTWYEVDVTDLFSKGNDNSVDAISIRIMSNSWNRAGYSSKEGSQPPELVIQMKEEDAIADSKPSDTVCSADVHECPDGSFVSRVAEHGCNFALCQDQLEMTSASTGLFFPVWKVGGDIACVDGAAPSWAKGAYLKDSKSACCKAFFMLQVDECLDS